MHGASCRKVCRALPSAKTQRRHPEGAGARVELAAGPWARNANTSATMAARGEASTDDQRSRLRPVVHHLVLFRFRADLPLEAIPALFVKLRALEESIEGITGFRGGVDASKEGLAKGFTHGFCMTFQDVAARDAYLPHPEHQRVVEQLLPLLEGGLEGVLTFDFRDGVL